MDWFRMVYQFHRNANLRLAHKFMLHMMSWYFYFFMVRPIFVHSKIKIPHAINDEFKNYKIFFLFYKFLSSSSNDVGRWNIFRWSIKFYWTKNIFVKHFLKNTTELCDMMWWHRCTCTCCHATHVDFGGFPRGVRKCTFWGGCQKWSFLGGVPKRVISDPPGGPKIFYTHPLVSPAKISII